MDKHHYMLLGTKTCEVAGGRRERDLCWVGRGESEGVGWGGAGPGTESDWMCRSRSFRPQRRLRSRIPQLCTWAVSVGCIEIKSLQTSVFLREIWWTIKLGGWSRKQGHLGVHQTQIPHVTWSVPAMLSGSRLSLLQPLVLHLPKGDDTCLPGVTPSPRDHVGKTPALHPFLFSSRGKVGHEWMWSRKFGGTGEN